MAVVLALPIFVARAYYSLGKPAGLVTDQANVLSTEQKQSLETKLEQFEATSTNQIAIAIIPSLKGDYIENFAVQLFKEWGIGQKGKDNGVLILVATDDHQMRIEVGYGLEGALTDAQSSWIINNTLKPAFKANDYYGGLDKATDQIISATKGEFSTTDQPAAKNALSGRDIEFLLILGWVILSAFIRLLSKSKSWWLGGVVGAIFGAIGGVIFGGLSLALILFFSFGFLGLIIDFFASKAGPKGPGGGLWFLGGGSGGFGNGGGGFGGFGGGGSGGGGASGGW